MPKQVLTGETNDLLFSIRAVRNRVSLVKSKVFRMCGVDSLDTFLTFVRTENKNPLGPVPLMPVTLTYKQSLV